MNALGMADSFADISKALSDMQDFYADAGAQALLDIDRRLMQFSRAHTIPVMDDVTRKFAVGRCPLAVKEALHASSARMVELLKAKISGLDVRVVYDALWDVAQETALYVGGGAILGGIVGGALGALAAGTGAAPGAYAGTSIGMEIGGLVMAAKGLAEMAEAIVHAVPALCKKMAEAFAMAWRAGLLPDSQRAEYRLLIAEATELFAEGELLLVMAILGAIVALLLKKGLAAVMEKLGKSKMGAAFANWVERNHESLSKQRSLQPQGAAAAEGGLQKPSLEKNAPPRAEAPKTKEKRPNEGEAAEPCPACVSVGTPVNPILGCKILADAIDLDFALPAPLPLVWQRTYSSAQRLAGWMGTGWATPLSLALQVNVDSVVVLDAFARGITFSLPDIGEILYSPSEKITLARTQDRSFELVDDTGSRDLFALPDTANNVARLVGQIDANGNRIDIVYN